MLNPTKHVNLHLLGAGAAVRFSRRNACAMFPRSAPPHLSESFFSNHLRGARKSLVAHLKVKTQSVSVCRGVTAAVGVSQEPVSLTGNKEVQDDNEANQKAPTVLRVLFYLFTHLSGIKKKELCLRSKLTDLTS